MSLALSAPDVRGLNRESIARLLRGDAAGALEGFRQCAELDGDFAEAWNNSGLVRLRLGALAEAVSDFDRAITVRTEYAEAWCNRGRARQALGDLTGALADFDRALACAQGLFAASVLHNRGGLKHRLGDLSGALADFDRALEINPDHVATFVERAAARKEAGDLEGARADLDHALPRVAPHLRAAVLHKRGGVRVLQGDFDGAVGDYTEALALEPDNAIFYLSRGHARYHKRDGQALVDYRMAFRLDADTSARELARMLREDAHGGAAEVLKNCRQHLRIDAQDVPARLRRGLTLLLLGLAAEAEADLEQASAHLRGLRRYLDQVIAQLRPAPGGGAR